MATNQRVLGKLFQSFFNAASCYGKSGPVYGIPDAGKSAGGQTVYATGVHILREFPVKLLQDRPIVHGCNFHFICQNTPLFYTILR
jgi:hypothetical protein